MGLMQITTLCAFPASQAKTKLPMTLDCSRIAKEIAMVSGIFCQRKEPDIACTYGVDICIKER